MSRRKAILPILFSILLLTSCSLFSGGGGTTEKIPLEGITLRANSTSVTVDETVTFTVTPTPANANTFDSKSFSVNYLEYFVDGTRFAKSKGTAEYMFTAVGNFEVYAKYCTHSQHSDTNGDLVSETMVVTVSEIDASLVLHVAQPEERSINIPQPTVMASQTWNYTLTASGEAKTFTYRATTANGVNITKGVFRFEATYSVDWKIRDSSNNLIKSTYSSTKTVAVDLDIGMTYSLTITKSTTSGYLEIKAYAPNGQSTISGYTNINDAMWYEGQEAYYLYKPSINGYYAFTLSYAAYWGVYDDYNNRVSPTQYSSTKSLSITLETAKTYRIIIAEDSVKGNYTLKVNVPNPIVDATGKLKIYDAMRFEKQRNTYSYRPAVAANYVFVCSYNVMWAISDDYGNVLKESKYSDSNTISLALESNKTYQLLLVQSAKTGEYVVKIQK